MRIARKGCSRLDMTGRNNEPDLQVHVPARVQNEMIVKSFLGPFVSIVSDNYTSTVLGSSPK
jgi:hypothetical protein